MKFIKFLEASNIGIQICSSLHQIYFSYAQATIVAVCSKITENESKVRATLNMHNS